MDFIINPGEQWCLTWTKYRSQMIHQMCHQIAPWWGHLIITFLMTNEVEVLSLHHVWMLSYLIYSMWPNGSQQSFRWTADVRRVTKQVDWHDECQVRRERGQTGAEENLTPSLTLLSWPRPANRYGRRHYGFSPVIFSLYSMSTRAGVGKCGTKDTNSPCNCPFNQMLYFICIIIINN